MKTTKKEILDNNKVAIKNAVQIEVGRTIINKAIKMLKENHSIPMMFKFTLDTALAPVIVGNIISFVLNECMDNSSKTEYIKDALIGASAQVMFSKLNIQDFINNLLEGINIPNCESQPQPQVQTQVQSQCEVESSEV